MIIIRPQSGLANRLRALDSAIDLAAKYKMKLHVIWELNRACNCKFSDLFIVPNEFDRLTEHKSGLTRKITRKIARKYFPRFNNYYLNDKKIKGLGKIDWFETLSNYNNIHISTCQAFYCQPSSSSFFGFRPRVSIQNIINFYREENMIGVHVRRTDNKASIAYSPIEKFVECMSNEIGKDNNVKFFLSTDDPSVEITLRTHFPNKIVTHRKKSLDRNNPLAIQDAVIDLYCLANCRKLIGSYYSSFSGIASEINGIDLITMKKSIPNKALH